MAYFPIVTFLARGLASRYAKVDLRRRFFAAAVDASLVMTGVALYTASGAMPFLIGAAIYVPMRDAVVGRSVGKFLLGTRRDPSRERSARGRHGLVAAESALSLAGRQPRGGGAREPDHRARSAGAAPWRSSRADAGRRRLPRKGAGACVRRVVAPLPSRSDSRCRVRGATPHDACGGACGVFTGVSSIRVASGRARRLSDAVARATLRPHDPCGPHDRCSDRMLAAAPASAQVAARRAPSSTRSTARRVTTRRARASRRATRSRRCRRRASCGRSTSA